jgi:hypothetical protein
VPGPAESPIDLELPADALARHKAVGLWYEGETLRVRAHLRDAYTEPDGTPLVLHEYRLDLWVDLATMEVTDVAVDPIHLPYGECFDAAPQVRRLVGLRLDADLPAARWLRLGPTSAVSVPGDDTLVYDADRWTVDDTGGELWLTNRVPRLTRCDRFRTGVRGRVSEPGRLRVDG